MCRDNIIGCVCQLSYTYIQLILLVRKNATNLVATSLLVELGEAGELLEVLSKVLLLDSELLFLVQLGTVDVSNQETTGLLELSEDIACQLDVAQEEVRALLDKQLVCEAGESLGVEKVLSVDETSGGVGKVEAGEGVDAVGVSADVEEFWLLDCHANLESH